MEAACASVGSGAGGRAAEQLLLFGGVMSRKSNNPPMAFARLFTPQPSAPDSRARMEKFVIEGGSPLSGTIAPAGNKNAALPALAACLLTEEEVVLRNIPRIRDVEDMLGLLTGLGVECS